MKAWEIVYANYGEYEDFHSWTRGVFTSFEKANAYLQAEIKNAVTSEGDPCYLACDEDGNFEREMIASNDEYWNAFIHELDIDPVYKPENDSRSKISRAAAGYKYRVW